MPDRHCAYILYIYTQHLGNRLSQFGMGVVHCAPRPTDSAPTATAFPPVTHCHWCWMKPNSEGKGAGEVGGGKDRIWLVQ